MIRGDRRKKITARGACIVKPEKPILSPNDCETAVISDFITERPSVWPPAGIKWYYSDSRVAIAHARCEDILPNLPQVAHVITDPPFSDTCHSRARTNKGGREGRGWMPNSLVDFDSITVAALQAIFEMFPAICQRWVIAFMDFRHVTAFEAEPPKGLDFVRFGVWLKTNGMPYLSGDRPSNGWDAIAYLHNSSTRMRWNGGGKTGNFTAAIERGPHPTTKPQAVLLPMMNLFTDRDEVILDPFCGSGSTLRAAKDLGRYGIGIETSERWAEIAADKCRQDMLW
jgi:site-specific DNA-methyltransferase (adenine-specific)